MRNSKLKKVAVVLSVCLMAGNINYGAVKAATIDDVINQTSSNANDYVKDYNESITNGTNSAGSVEDAINNFIDGLTNSTVNSGTDPVASTPDNSNNGSSDTANTTDANIANTVVEELNTVVSNINTNDSKVKISTDIKSADTYNTYLKNELTIDLKSLLNDVSLMPSVGVNTAPTIDSNIQASYVFLKNGEVLSDNTVWNNVENGAISLSEEGIGVVYIKLVKDNQEVIVKTNGFTIDKTKPVISGAKWGKTYTKAVTLSLTDNLSGIKKATVNGKVVDATKGVVISQKGYYTIKVCDNSYNTKSLSIRVK